MAPTTTRSQRDESIERGEEYDDFIRRVDAYHQQRGTSFDPHPKVGNRPVDLLQLYKTVKKHGGYDRVSAEKLLWRRIGQDFNLGVQNLPALAFSLKTVYYKNLAAYEISTEYNQEPPPKEILEEVTAKGGDLLHRTLDNFKRPTSRESGNLANGHDTDSGEEGQATPKEDRLEIDDPGSGGRTRSLRQQPPQRILWQPDTASSRPARHNSTHANSPQPQSMQPSLPRNPAMDPNSAMFNIQSWEGSQRPHAMTLQPVITPGNNPDLFRQRKLQELQASLQKTLPNPMAPIIPRPKHSTFAGPNIYIRCLNGLLCPIPEEQEFALHHLVKVSHERGDKFKFQSFPGLVEAVVKKGLEISSLFYDVTWDVVYDNDSMTGPHCLNGATGTSDIIARINHHPSITPRDDIRSKDFTYKLERLNEAGLVLRNMTMLEENAQHLSEFPIVKDFLCIALNLPNDPNASEFKHYALEVAEQLTIYWEFKPGDPLLQSLIGLLGSKDRGTALGALVSINRASMELETNNNLTDVPIPKIAYLIELARQDDEELVGACMDFLYQFTAHPQNVETMLKDLNLARDLVPRLISLLMYGVRVSQRRIPPRGLVQKPPPPVEIPQFPKELIEGIGKLAEPERSIKWLQCCFEENEEQEVTQIHLWQSYQNCFAEFTTPVNQMLQASEFIKRVSSTFNGATAQVINGPQPRFIIKGIQPKKKPRDLDGRIHENCKWIHNGKACPHHFFNAEEGFHHIAQDHLGIIRDEKNEYNMDNDDKSKKYACLWAGCAGYGKDRGDSRAVMRHVRPHLEKPQAPKTDAAKHEPLSSVKVITYQATQQDERGNPAGLPLTSVLILRNLARYASRLDQGEQLMWDLFAADRQKLFDVFANNVALQNYMADLILMVDGHIKRRP